MADSTLWWVLAGGAVAVELATGTFYLLMLALGFAAGAVAAQFDLEPTAQMVVAALVGGGAVLLWRSYKRRNGGPLAIKTEANPDVNQDIGGGVQVTQWQADGTASVHYRGARWAATMAAGHTAAPGQHRIVAVVGNRLVVEKIAENVSVNPAPQI